MSIEEELRGIAAEFGLDSKEEKGVVALSRPAAEKKGFLSKRKVTYRALYKIDPEKKELHFTEFLVESGSGAGGTGSESWSTGRDKEGPEGRVGKRMSALAKKYQIHFPAVEVGVRFRQAAEAGGYAFTYQKTPRKVRKA